MGSFDRAQYRELNRSRYDEARSVFDGARARLESRPSFRGVKEEAPKYDEKPKPTVNDVTVSRSPTGIALKTNAFSAPSPDAKPLVIKPSRTAVRSNTIDTPPRPRVAVSSSTYVRDVHFAPESAKAEPVKQEPVKPVPAKVETPLALEHRAGKGVEKDDKSHGVVTLYDGSRVISHIIAKSIGITLPCTLADMTVAQFDKIHDERMSEVHDILEFAKNNQ